MTTDHARLWGTICIALFGEWNLRYGGPKACTYSDHFRLEFQTHDAHFIPLMQDTNMCNICIIDDTFQLEESSRESETILKGHIMLSF